MKFGNLENPVVIRHISTGFLTWFKGIKWCRNIFVASLSKGVIRFHINWRWMLNGIISNPKVWGGTSRIDQTKIQSLQQQFIRKCNPNSLTLFCRGGGGEGPFEPFNYIVKCGKKQVILIILPNSVEVMRAYILLSFLGGFSCQSPTDETWWDPNEMIQGTIFVVLQILQPAPPVNRWSVDKQNAAIHELRW